MSSQDRKQGNLLAPFSGCVPLVVPRPAIRQIKIGSPRSVHSGLALAWMFNPRQRAGLKKNNDR